MLINYLQLDDQLDEGRFQLLKQHLPEKLTKRNGRFVRFRDRQRNLLGLLLLKKTWATQFDAHFPFEKLRSNKHNRPYLPNSQTDFNISHAGDYVICVLHPRARVGIDIEMNRRVDFHEFKITMNQDQWDQINSSIDPEATFFKFWCIKESVIKADGRGLSIPLTGIMIEDEQVHCGEQVWYIKPFMLDQRHFGCLASDNRISSFNMQEVNWRDFLV